MKSYKVVRVKASGYSSRQDPQRLEQIMNEHAREGWSVLSVATTHILSLSGERYIVVMEKEA